jgi:fibro-slime domain-containing protein
MKAIIAFFLLTFILGSLAQTKASSISIYGTVYDFSNGNVGGHPDFNTYLCGVQKGMVEDQLGDDNKPVLKDTKSCLTSTDSFNQWFRDTPGVNYVFPNVELVCYWDEGSQSYKYRNDQFFPVDGRGYGYEGMPHNYGFCYEFHSSFTYAPGQNFDFTGDDDVWVFINRQLVIDLGGVHGSASDSVSLSSLGLTEGQSYPLDFFFCERHETDSHLWFSTSIVIDPCGTTDTDGDGFPDLCDPCPLGDISFNVWNEKQMGPDNTVIFHIDLTSAITETYTVRVNYGDEAFETTGDPSGITGWIYYDVTPGFTIPHSYKEPGEYTVYFEGSNLAGCGKGPSAQLHITVGGKRLAPKCSDFSVVPGAPAKRKRSL